MCNLTWLDVKRVSLLDLPGEATSPKAFDGAKQVALSGGVLLVDMGEGQPTHILPLHRIREVELSRKPDHT